MRPPATATSARYCGLPVPSITVPLRISRSYDMAVLLFLIFIEHSIYCCQGKDRFVPLFYGGTRQASSAALPKSMPKTALSPAEHRFTLLQERRDPFMKILAHVSLHGQIVSINRTAMHL